MGTWRKIRLGDTCVTNANSYSPKEGWKFVNYLDTGSITDNRVNSIQYVDVANDKLPSRARRKVKENSIIYSMVRPNQRHFGIIKTQPENFLVSTGFVVIDVDADVLDADFLYYLLTRPILVEALHAIAEQSTSAYPSIKPSDIEDLEVTIPELAIQKKIASLLGSLDRKIAQNTEINENLEQQATTLFKALFVDLAPFDGTTPPNWTISTLGDVTEMGAGGDKPKEFSPVKTPLCPYPIYSNGINDYGLYGYTNEPKIKVESVTVSARGTIGYVCLRHIPYVPIVRLVTLVPDTKMLSAKYLYLYLRLLHITGTGTTQQQLTVPDFRKTEIVIPDKNIMGSFTETVTPLFERIWANEDENTKLAEVRDALLPKLMSGGIDVSSVQL